MNCATNNILIFRGVFADHIDAPAVEEGVPFLEQMRGAGRITATIPRRFTGLADWPMVTSLRCWTCGLVPEGRPKFVPGDADAAEWPTIGNFCEWGCCIRYIRAEYPRAHQADAEYEVAKVASIFLGRQVTRIPPGPPKTLMKEYSGRDGLTTDEYRTLYRNTMNQYMI